MIIFGKWLWGKKKNSYYRKESEIKTKSCPLCGKDMKGFILTHYKCKECNQQFTD